MKKTSTFRKFTLYDGDGIPPSAYGGSKILLYPFKNMSIQSFSFPFAGISRVREALKIQYRPLLGEASNRVSIIPFFVSSDKKSSSGCVFLLFGDERREIEEAIKKNNKSEDYQVWPAALAFADEVEGNGLILWKDDESITTLWVDDWVPKFYKTVSASDTNTEEEERLALAFISQQGGDVGSVFSVSKADLVDSDVQSYGTQTLSRCAAYEQLDLSNRGTNLLEQRERAIGALAGAARLSIAFGLLFLLLSAGIYLFQGSLLTASAQSMEGVYSASFGENSRQPLSSARAKVRSLQSPETVDNSLHTTLRSLTAVWDKLTASNDIYIETLRYGADNTDILGTADNNESIQRVRQLLEEEGFSARTDNIQTIPSGELRFNLNISRGSTP